MFSGRDFTCWAIPLHSRVEQCAHQIFCWSACHFNFQEIPAHTVIRQLEALLAVSHTTGNLVFSGLQVYCYEKARITWLLKGQWQMFLSYLVACTDFLSPTQCLCVCVCVCSFRLPQQTATIILYIRSNRLTIAEAILCVFGAMRRPASCWFLRY